MAADLDMNVTIEVCPTVREADGLAMSSRNSYLSREERRQAPKLRQALVEATRAIEHGETDPRVVEEAFRAQLAQAPLARLDYLEIVGASDLARLVTIHGEVLVAAAVWFGNTRLIDNMMAVSPD
jgi:pantoate--beta-alanine ligase